MTTNRQWIERDLRHLWHPCTQMKDHEWLPLVPIRRGSGSWLQDFDGFWYLDIISSWWVNLLGHANPRINRRVAGQLEQLEHVLLAGFSHAPAVELAERLVNLAPTGLERCFYSDNGSSAVEVALKMSFHYWRNKGQRNRSRFIALHNSYHGETLGALSVSDVALYRETYDPLLLDPILVRSPDCYDRAPGASWEEHSRAAFTDMEAALERHHEQVCAVIVEPLVQCAGSMRMYHPVYLQLLREACDRYGVHFIADEIAVGFGRTGTLFACEQADVSPDFLCLSKGLTGGYLPLSVTLTGNEVFQAFYDDYKTLRAFLHSHSYTGNPLGCSAALATLDILDQDDVIAGNADLIEALRAAGAKFRDHPHVGDVRQTGTILAVEMVQQRNPRTPYPWEERRGLRAYQYGLKNGVLLRPLGNVLYFMPPYVTTGEEIEFAAEVAYGALEVATRD